LVELGIPEGGALRHPLLGFLHSRSTSADEVQAAFAVALDEAGPFEDAEMLGESGRGNAEGPS